LAGVLLSTEKSSLKKNLNCRIRLIVYIVVKEWKEGNRQKAYRAQRLVKKAVQKAGMAL